MQARIYQPTKTSMQSGEGKKYWVLEFLENPNAKFKEQLMGRTSSSDMTNEVKLKFSSYEKALAFANKNGYEVEVIPQKNRAIIKKSYARNFT